MTASPALPLTEITTILDLDREPTLDELIDQAWLEQILAIAQLADEIEAAANVDPLAA
jgi:hypothetical protein